MLGHPSGHWRMTLIYHSYTNTRSKIRQFKDFNVEVEIIKVLEENMGETIYILRRDNVFPTTTQSFRD